MDPTYPLVPVLNFLFAFLVLLLLPWRFNSWSVGIRVHIIWLALLCACRGINSTVWKDHTRNVSPAWCEIVIRIQIGGSVAIPSCTFSIVRRLYHTTCSGKISTTKSEKRRECIVDLMLSLGCPIIVMALVYVVQGHRYDILEEIGCMITTVNTWLLYVLVLMWPPIFGTISSIYAVLIMRVFIKQHKELNEVLTNESSKVNYSRFYRAFALTSVDILLTIPLSIIVIYLDAVVQGPVLPWTGWSDIHYNYSRVDTVPAFVWRNPVFARNHPTPLPWLRFYFAWNQWVYVFCTFVFIAIYGTTGEVVRYYVGLFWKAAGFFGWAKKKPVDNMDNQTRSKPRKKLGELSTILFQSGAARQPEAITTVTWATRSEVQNSNSSSGSSINLHEDTQKERQNLTPVEVEVIHEIYSHETKDQGSDRRVIQGESNV